MHNQISVKKNKYDFIESRMDTKYFNFRIN